MVDFVTPHYCPEIGHSAASSSYAKIGAHMLNYARSTAGYRSRHASPPHEPIVRTPRSSLAYLDATECTRHTNDVLLIVGVGTDVAESLGKVVLLSRFGKSQL